MPGNFEEQLGLYWDSIGVMLRYIGVIHRTIFTPSGVFFIDEIAKP